MKTKLRVWPSPYDWFRWKVQIKPWWCPVWWTVATCRTLDEAKWTVRELEKDT